MNGWRYMTKDCAVIPFSPGTVVYRDGMLSTLYYAAKELGRLEYIFCGDIPDHDHFIRMFDESKKVTQILCTITNQGQPTEIVNPVGWSWVEIPKGVDGQRSALCGFAFIKRSRFMYDLGALGIAYWMEALKIDVVHGVMLRQNRPALKYAAALGFTHEGIVPRFHFYRGELVAAMVMMAEREKFLPNFETWFANKKL